MKIKMIPSDMDAPGFYRLLAPARQLVQQGGHTVTMPPSKRYKLEDGSLRTMFDVDDEILNAEDDIWILQQRKERMWATGPIFKLRERGAATVADVDDNYIEIPSWNPGFYGTHPYIRDDGVIINRQERRKGGTKYKVQPNKQNAIWMMETFKQVDAMTVSTPYLKELYARFNDDITVIRNYVDWDMWDDLTPMYDIERERLRVGYLGAFRYRKGDLSVLKPWFPKWIASHPEVDFVANTEEVHAYLEVPEEQRVTIGEWTFFPEGEKNYPLAEMTGVLDIGLVPLMPGGFAEGKSHLKGMEYNAAGAPFIASNTESYRYWTDQEAKYPNGFIAEKDSDWIERLELLVTDDETRRLCGSVGRATASAHSIQNHWGEYEQTFYRLLGDRYTALARGAITNGAVQKVSELSFVLEHADELLLHTVVEVGSARGGTFWSFAQIAEDDALLVSIDIPAGSPLDMRDGQDVYTGRDRDRFLTFVKETQQCVLIDADSQAESTRMQLMGVLAGREIDLLFIDADHRYQGVKRDFELYSPLVREGGLIGFHDVIPQKVDYRSGVHLLWQELQRKHPNETMQFVGTDGWGMKAWGGVGLLRKVPSLVRAG